MQFGFGERRYSMMFDENQPTSSVTHESHWTSHCPFNMHGHGHQYSDVVVSRPWQNRFLVKSNNLLAYLYRNFTNTSILSSKSVVLQSRLSQIELVELENETKRVMLDKLVRYYSNRAQMIRSDPKGTKWDLRGGKIHSSGGQPVRSGEQITKDHVITSIPRRNDRVFYCFLIIQILLALHALFVCYNYCDWYPKQAIISSSPLPAGKNKTAIKLNRSIEIVTLASSSSGHPVNNTTDTECLNRIEEYFNENYGEFYVWNVSSSRQDVSAREFSLLEQPIAVQQFGDEIAALQYCALCYLITIGLVTSWLTSKKTYDVAPLGLIHEPKFMASSLQYRLFGYLDLIRQSYMNFWAAFAIKSMHNNKLSFKEENQMDLDGDISDESSDEEALSEEDDTTRFKCENSWCNQTRLRQPPPNDPYVVDSLCLSYKLFANYLPTIRSQSWRRFLVIAHPIAFYCFLAQVILGNIALWSIFFYDAELEKNSNVRMFLLDKEQHQPNSVSSLYLKTDHQHGAKCHETFQRFAKLIRRAMAEMFANELSAYNPNLSRSLRAIAAAPHDSGNLSNYQVDLLTTLMANNIGPYEIPSFHHWIAPVFLMIVIVKTIVLYLVILFTTISDLCVGLMELRLKLTICIKLLSHYQALLVDGQRGDSLISMLNLDRLVTMARNSAPSVNSGNSSKRQPGGFQARNEFLKSQNCRSQQSVWSAFRQHCQFNGMMPSLRQRLIRKIFIKWRDTGKTLAMNKKEPPISGGIGSGNDAKLLLCNTNLRHILAYLVANRYKRDEIGDFYAYKLIYFDMIDSLGMRKTSKKFLISTYLDFRLFMDQIENCRGFMVMLIVVSVFHGLNLIVSSTYLDNQRAKISLALAGLALANIILILPALFHSNCCKLQGLIHSILACCTTGDKTIMHLALLWRRALTDLTGSKSKLAFGISSMRFAYTSVLQVSNGNNFGDDRQYDIARLSDI